MGCRDLKSAGAGETLEEASTPRIAACDVAGRPVSKLGEKPTLEVFVEAAVWGRSV